MPANKVAVEEEKSKAAAKCGPLIIVASVFMVSTQSAHLQLLFVPLALVFVFSLSKEVAQAKGTNSFSWFENNFSHYPLLATFALSTNKSAFVSWIIKNHEVTPWITFAWAIYALAVSAFSIKFCHTSSSKTALFVSKYYLIMQVAILNITCGNIINFILFLIKRSNLLARPKDKAQESLISTI